MTLNRGSFLGLTGLTIAGVAGAGSLTGCAGSSAGSGQTAELLTSWLPLPERFKVPLPIPTVKRPSAIANGADLYEIVRREADQEIIPGFQTPVFGYDGTFPGPTIVSRRGRPTVVRHTNNLGVPTVLHLHGGHTPADSDGYPTDLLLPEGGVQLRGPPRTTWAVTYGPAAESISIRWISGRARSGIPTIGWTSPPRRCGAAWPGSTSCTTTRRTRSACRPGSATSR